MRDARIGDDPGVRRPVKSRLRRLGWIGAAFTAGYALLRRRDVH